MWRFVRINGAALGKSSWRSHLQFGLYKFLSFFIRLGGCSIYVVEQM